MKRRAFALYVLFVAACSMWNGMGQARGDNPWVIGDWLINYSSGFVRRGLPGAVVMLLHQATGIRLERVVFGLQAGVFLIFLFAVYRLTKGIRWSYLMVAVLISPATLAFTVLEADGFRKEILLFAALGLVIWMLISERWKDWQISVVLTILLVGLTLSHEGMLVAAPFFFAAVVIQMKDWGRSVRLFAIPLVMTGGALVAVVLHHGDLAQAQAICRSVGGQVTQIGLGVTKQGLCAGAISAIQQTHEQAHGSVVMWVREHDLASLCGWLAIPAFAPLIWLLVRLYRRDGLRREVMVVVACTLVALPGFAALFYVGGDWGRWLHMLAMCLMLLAMMIDVRAAGGETNGVSAGRLGVWGRALATVALLVYATTWALPSTGGVEAQTYVGYVRQPHHKLHRIGMEIVDKIAKVRLR